MTYSTPLPDLIRQGEYAQTLRPYLPAAAFQPDRTKLLILAINLALWGLGLGMANYLDRYPWYALVLFLPVTLVLGNAVIVLLFSTHDLMHSGLVKHPGLRRGISLLGLALLWMPPTLWHYVHNRVHHAHTNSHADPDRSYLAQQPATWGKWIQHQFVPSAEVNPVVLAIGMTMAWGVHAFRNLTSVLVFNTGNVDYVPAAFRVKPRDRWAIAGETLLIATLHLGILCYLQFHPVKLVLAYFLPIGLGYAGVLFYVYTNHMLCPMTEENDPLINSVSLRVPPLFDQLHLNFSYHTEHHVFPGVNSDYYPQVQALLQTHYPDRFNLLPAATAWKLLLTTPRHYVNATTLTTATGDCPQPCPTLVPGRSVQVDPSPMLNRPQGIGH
jgi:fatty acid desaturase